MGHAGTLDPMATGVLLVLLGQATRINEYLLLLPKTYRATIRLGIATDTYDATGATISTSDCSEIEPLRLQQALQEFTGEILQTPPPYSAVKVGGQPAYKRARQNLPVQLQPRRVTINRIELLSYEHPYARAEVECGSGTYIRALAHDLGLRLGCGAHLSALERTSIGGFEINQALSPEEIEIAFHNGSIAQHITPIASALSHLPQITLAAPYSAMLTNGQPIPLDASGERLPQDGSGSNLALAIDEQGTALAIARADFERCLWLAEKVFAGNS